MNDNLLVSLRKYKRSDKRDPIENFITEAFAWLLSSYTDYSNYFLNKIASKLEDEITLPPTVNWNTQVNFKGFYPDLVCEYENSAIIFEHKIWSYLHDNQLFNYREFAEKKYESYCLILITGHVRQHDQKPDLALCWYDVYKITEDWLGTQTDKIYFMFSSFLRLLEYEGLGPAAPISHNSILSYYSARNFIKNTESLIKRIMNSNDKLIEGIAKQHIDDFELCFEETKLWGRTGFALNALMNWKPSVFIGFLINGEDHSTKSILGDMSPDFCFLISFHGVYHGKYEFLSEYKMLKEYIENSLELESRGWDIYNHIEDTSVIEKNYWHPIHIRKPMIELFRGTRNAEEQEIVVIEAIKEILPLIVDSDQFRGLREKIKNIDAQQCG